MATFKEAGIRYSHKANIKTHYHSSNNKINPRKLTEKEQQRTIELLSRGYNRSQAYDIIEMKKIFGHRQKGYLDEFFLHENALAG